MKKPDNPFVLSGFYGRPWFCDREDELQTLHNHLENERNVVLYSWRRMGKTALIRCLFDELEKTNAVSGIYVDLLATDNMHEAIRAIATEVHEKYGKTKGGLSAALQKLFATIGVSLSFNPMTGQPELSFGLKQQTIPERSLHALGTFLSNRKNKIWLALDEFQQVAGFDNEHAEAIFRSWAQAFPNIRFIYSGSHRKLMQAIFTEKNRPFYQSAQLLSLDPIPRSTYSKFIQQHFKANNRSINDQTIQSLYSWSRGQTYCIQLVCNHLFGNYSKANQKNLEETYQRIIDQEKPIFASFQKMLSDTQWRVLKGVAREEPLTNPYNNEFISKYQLGAPSSVGTALNALIKKELLIEQDGSYYVHDVLMARWLQSL